MSVIKCERSVMVMTLHWHSSQVSGLDNGVDDTLTETGLTVTLFFIKGKQLLFPGHETSENCNFST